MGVGGEAMGLGDGVGEWPNFNGLLINNAATVA